MIDDEKLYEALGDVLRGNCESDDYVFVYAIYEPDDDGGPHEGMYHAAVDMHEEGETYHVWFIVTDDDRIVVGDIERWFMG